MRSVKTKGIILVENNMGDYDKMLTMLTPGLGKIGCHAKGARRSKSSLMAGTQFLCFGEYLLFKGNDTYNINSCEPIEIFYNIRIDYDKLNYVAEIIKIVCDVTNENDNSYRILQLLLNTLYTISELDKNLDLVLAIFKIRLLSILGFSPKIDKCQDCEEELNIKYFSIKDDGIKCGACGKIDKSAIEISEGTLTAIRYIIKAPAKKIFSFNISQECIKELKLVAKIYLNEKLEKEYKI